MQKPGQPLHLHHAWNYYFFRGYANEREEKELRETGKDKQAYRERLEKIDHNITTVQEFWVCYLELPKPSDMKPGYIKQGFFLCRQGCRPEWEDEEVKNGGCWVITISDNKTDETWKHLLIAAIGQRFSTPEIGDDEVVAIQFETQLSGGIRIKVWNKQAEMQYALKKQILDVLKPLNADISFYCTFSERKH